MLSWLRRLSSPLNPPQCVSTSGREEISLSKLGHRIMQPVLPYNERLFLTSNGPHGVMVERIEYANRMLPSPCCIVESITANQIDSYKSRYQCQPSVFVSNGIALRDRLTHRKQRPQKIGVGPGGGVIQGMSVDTASSVGFNIAHTAACLSGPSVCSDCQLADLPGVGFSGGFPFYKRLKRIRTAYLLQLS